MTKLKETQEKWKKTLENTMYRPSSPQDIRNPNGTAEISVNESMNSYFKNPSGTSFCTKSNISVFDDSTTDICSTIDRSSPLPESYPTRQSSGDDESHSFSFPVKIKTILCFRVFVFKLKQY